jgi:hypothetical protein
MQALARRADGREYIGHVDGFEGGNRRQEKTLSLGQDAGEARVGTKIRWRIVPLLNRSLIGLDHHGAICGAR